MIPKDCPKNISWASETDSSQVSLETTWINLNETSVSLTTDNIFHSIIKTILKSEGKEYLEKVLRANDPKAVELAKFIENFLIRIVKDENLSKLISKLLQLKFKTKPDHEQIVHCPSCWVKLLSAQDSIELFPFRKGRTGKNNFLITSTPVKKLKNRTLTTRSNNSESLDVNMSEEEIESEIDAQSKALNPIDRLLEVKEELDSLKKKNISNFLKK